MLTSILGSALTQRLARECEIEKKTQIAFEPKRLVRIRSFTRLKPFCVRDLDIAHVQDLLRMNGLSFQASFTKHLKARSLYRRSNPNSHRVSFSSSFCAWFESKQSPHRNKHINNVVNELILRNLDVLRLVPSYLSDFLLGDGFRFSARSKNSTTSFRIFLISRVNSATMHDSKCQYNTCLLETRLSQCFLVVVCRWSSLWTSL